jgi:fatty-acyl-CoA synthase
VDLSHWIERHARFAPRSVAIRYAGGDIGYAELAASIRRAAAALAQRGVEPGDVVAYLGRITRTLPCCYLPARAWARCRCLNWRSGPSSARVLADCSPRSVGRIGVRRQRARSASAQPLPSTSRSRRR